MKKEFKKFFGDKGLVNQINLNNDEKQQLELLLKNNDDDKTIKHESFMTEMFKNILNKIKSHKLFLIKEQHYEKAATARDLEKTVETKILTNSKTFKESLQTMIDFKSNLIFGNYGFEKCLEVDKMIVDNTKQELNIVINELDRNCFLTYILSNIVGKLNDGIKINIIILKYNGYYVDMLVDNLQELSEKGSYEPLKKENLKIFYPKSNNPYGIDDKIKSDLFFITADNDKYRLNMNDEIDNLHFMACFNAQKSENLIKMNKYFDYLITNCNEVLL